MKKFLPIISAFIVCLIALLPQAGYAQPGVLDTTFNPASAVFTQGVTTGTSFDKSVKQQDGKILISGVINNYNGVTINANNSSSANVIRINANGTLDESFNNNGLTEGLILSIGALAVQADGKIIIAGGFTGYDGVPGNGIMRLNTDGSVDNSFAVGTGFHLNSFNFFLQSISIQSNGQIIVSGNFDEYNGVSRKGIARLNTDGSLDNSFNPGASINFASGVPSIRNTVLQSDGKIILSGFSVTNVGQNFTNYEILRVNTDGSVDNSFITPFPASTYHSFSKVFVQPDDKLVVFGGLPWGSGYATLSRLNADGSIDNAFNAGYTSGYSNSILDIKFQADGKIILAGSFDNYRYAPDVSGSAVPVPGKIIRLMPNGTIDPGFTAAPGVILAGGAGIVWFLELQSNEKIITGINDYLNDKSYVKRLNADGSLDSTTAAGAIGGSIPNL